MDEFFDFVYLVQTQDFWGNFALLVAIGGIIGYAFRLTKPNDGGILFFRRVFTTIAFVAFLVNLAPLVHAHSSDLNWIPTEPWINWSIVAVYGLWTYIATWATMAVMEKRFPNILILVDLSFYREVTHPTKKK